MRFRPMLAAATLVAAAVPSVLLAADGPYEPVTVTIKVSDLDPARDADKARYETRLKSAARAACRTGLDDAWARAAQQRCVEDVITQAGPWAN